MPKIFSDHQRKRVIELHDGGMSNVDIAKRMAEEFPADWTSKHAAKTVGRILAAAVPISTFQEIAAKTLDEMTREERSNFIERKLRSTPRFQMAFKSFDETEKAVFIDEYMNVMRSTDTLTEVEEQSLFTAILELILAFQALNRKEMEEKWREQSLRGELVDTDPRYRRHVDNKYQVEYDQHMKLNQKIMEGLAMARKDRVKEIRSQKQTLLDLAESLSLKTTQIEAADDISRLAKMRDEELKRLIDGGHLYGVFE